MNELKLAAAVDAVHAGDVAALAQLLREDPWLATTRIGGRTLLHVATDWPGHFPNVRATIGALVEAGADVNARFEGAHSETPLHWAASSDDVEALDALLDAGADIAAPGAVIGGGTPLADAVAFAQWRAARRLTERGSPVTLGQAAALGLLDRLEQICAADPQPAPDEITAAFWAACRGGQRRTAEYLRGRGADLNWIGWDNLAPIDAARRAGAHDLVQWLEDRGAKPAGETHHAR